MLCFNVECELHEEVPTVVYLRKLQTALYVMYLCMWAHASTCSDSCQCIPSLVLANLWIPLQGLCLLISRVRIISPISFSSQVIGNNNCAHIYTHTYQTLCQKSWNVSDSVELSCRESFFPASATGGDGGRLCKPKCSQWVMYDQPTETVSLAIIGTSTVVGIVTTIVVVILSCIHFRSM